MKTIAREMRFQGEPICRGIAVGAPLFFIQTKNHIPEYNIQEKEIDREISRLERAITKSTQDFHKIKQNLVRERIDEGAEIIDAHLEIMNDPILFQQVVEEIQASFRNAEAAFHQLMHSYEERFAAMEDPFFKERGCDIHGITERVLCHLLEQSHISLADLPEDSIVFSRELTASDAAEANGKEVLAFVTERGGATSHAAIVAKAKGIPYISNIPVHDIQSDEIEQVIVDGRVGELILNPTPKTLKMYQEIQQAMDDFTTKVASVCPYPSETFDGYPISLSANIDSVHEIDYIHQYGGGGVGLFRSEYLFLSNQKFPTEAQQYKVYRDLVRKMEGKPLVIRTFDVGGDKLTDQQKLSSGENPFFGCRAIRLLLSEPAHFKAQLRAICRASIEGDVRIMFPMISSLSELLESKKLLCQVREELMREGVKLPRKTPIGCMIEVPSAAVIADLLARECDFLSIGTNDLVQYSLAVDRGNEALGGMYNPTDPSVLRLIKLVVTEANHYGIPVTVCGEVASDPRFTSLLLGLGVHELSVSVRFLPLIKYAIRNMSIVEASHMAEMALRLTHASEIDQLITKTYRKIVPDDSYYNC